VIFVFRKVVGVLLAMSIFVSVGALPSYASGASNLYDSDYITYDMETGEITYHLFEDLPQTLSASSSAYSPGYFPDGCETISTVSTFAIIGSDNRTRVNPTDAGPYCNTVYVQSTFSNGSTIIGSGFMLGPSSIVTAGHCVYNNNSLATSVTVIPARNGSINPYGSATSTSITVSPQYITGGSTSHDWAIVENDSALGNQTGWLGLRWQTATYNDTYVYNTGYPTPSTTPGQTAGQSYMFLGSGYVESSSTNILNGDWDATSGNSGGPVFAYYSATGYTAIGILTSGSAPSTDGSSYPTAYTTATRITQDMFNLFVQYRP
jgi:glutamyl endopeptidase